MSNGSATMPGAPGAEVRALMTRAAAADLRARDLLSASIDDAFLPPDGRLDDRTRTGLTTLIAALVDTVEGELVEHAARLLLTRGEGAMAERLNAGLPVMDRLIRAGLLRDAEFAGECLARVRLDQLSVALPVDAGSDADTPSLLARLAQSSDRVVATAAAATMIGESHRRGPAEGGALPDTGLPATLHARLVWWVAAALRDRAATVGADPAAFDRAIAESALRNLAAHVEGDRLEATAMRLAVAIDARTDELSTVIEEVLRDRRLSVLAAVLAHALALRYEVARDLLVDPAGDRLWLALRTLDVPRATIARLGFQLCEADPRRDVDGFADTLDVVASIDPAVAAIAIAPLRLHPGYRAALAALDAGGGRR